MKATEQYFPVTYAIMKKVFLIRCVTKYVRIVTIFVFRRSCLIPSCLPDFPVGNQFDNRVFEPSKSIKIETKWSRMAPTYRFLFH